MQRRKLDRKALLAATVLALTLILALLSSLGARASLFQGVQAQEVFVTGLDGAKLRCIVFKPAQASGRLPAVIVVHGLGASSDTMNAISTELARNGVLVLALNYRGHDGSEGGVNYIGDPIAAPNISNDLVASLNYLLARDDVDAKRIGVVGYSMGSRAALRLGLLVPTVNPVVMIGPYYSWEIGGVNTTSPKNLLIIVGENDVITPPSSALLLFNYATRSEGKPGEVFGSLSSGTGRKLVIVPGADHYTIPFAKQTIQEVVGWVLQSYGLGAPKLYLDPTVLGGLAGTASFLTLIGVAAVIYLASKFQALEKPQQAPVKTARGILLIALVSLYYLTVAFYILPLVVDWGWRVYQFAMFSGGQYTIYYFAFLALALLVPLAILAVRDRALPGRIAGSLRRNLTAGIVTVLAVWIVVYVLYNATLTGVVANYAMNPLRLALMVYLTVILFPLVLVDEAVLRLLIQERIPTRRPWLRVAATFLLEYALRVLPLAWWVAISSNPLAMSGILANYSALNLISGENLDVVKAFMPMNAYGLYYAFSSVELLHALAGSYVYEEYRSLLASTLVRASTVAFTMAAVLAIL
ncbi:alpha/beta hydrolase family protein [Infirmifilum sp. NZ]|uniref:alpha/beta hydrolase family protein n=1 Tax=Infirmifilum sp. NZ TaxID=2926850 RepID=UPI0027AB1955|nr:alpha/beta fold hydrolase [Infirmifilum sp. NZ]UNQ73498.1 alpha/beta fold hydrolase [Infirmifilum sp. NZ]